MPHAVPLASMQERSVAGFHATAVTLTDGGQIEVGSTDGMSRVLLERGLDAGRVSGNASFARYFRADQEPADRPRTSGTMLSTIRSSPVLRSQSSR